MNFNFSVGPYGLEHLEHMCSSCSKILYFKYFEDEVGNYFLQIKDLQFVQSNIDVESRDWKSFLEEQKNWGSGKIIR